MAAWLSLKCFATELTHCDILLTIDNTTTIMYVNKIGGVRYLKLAKELRQLCKKRDIWVYASYITSKDNKEADVESRRVEPETEYALSKSAFKTITTRLGLPEIDLFATRTNSKCEKYISWKKDSGCFTIDAFTVSWNK